MPSETELLLEQINVQKKGSERMRELGSILMRNKVSIQILKAWSTLGLPGYLWV